MEMLKEVKELWVKALRSGKFEQGTEFLVSEDPDGSDTQYCCLGVLCELYVNEKKERDWNELEVSEEILPEEVMEWSGLSERNPVVIVQGIRNNISAFNDGTARDEDGHGLEQSSFNEIADIIEEQL